MVMKELDQDKSDGKIAEFQYAYVNAMEMRGPGDMYVEIWRLLSQNKQILTVPRALMHLRMCVSDAPTDDIQMAETVPHLKNGHGKRTPFVLVVDEIDEAMTKKMTLFYNLFDWPLSGFERQSMAQLILIGISNIVNLEDRLPANLQSRLSIPSLHFHSYQAEDFISIITNKIKTTNFENVSAVTLKCVTSNMKCFSNTFLSQSSVMIQSFLLRRKWLEIQVTLDHYFDCVQQRCIMFIMS